eukprot:CAMPEP_0194134702 /NCGR_PEP_ID=MMETSP0152-20130528/4773_1 /TAXON_ID=1049557 /ORGANISM="Thalassiothrix antarctica, Strain L6-D1" /LENGTH=571 /DNA_ID=CAMNT_0038830553 /DNA_START=108 /DNA_END=1823 /DNA_ORIENTATION=+
MKNKSTALVLFTNFIALAYFLPQLIAFPLIIPLSPSLSNPSSLFFTNNENNDKKKLSLRQRIFSSNVIRRLSRTSDPIQGKKKVEPKDLKIEITTVEGLEEHFSDTKRLFRKNKGASDEIDYDALVRGLYVEGKTQIIGSKNHPDAVHPTLQLLHERRRTKSPLTPVDESREDGMKVALVVEGGGMRGCATAGMVTAIHYLGLEDTFDVIYGSSAGTIIGAYFNTRQLPYFGPEIYYDSLTTAGKKFIDKSRLIRSLGFGLLNPMLIKDVLTRRENGKPVLDLNFLLKETMIEKKPLNWDRFVEMQKVQPLKVVSSNLKRNSSIVLEMANGGFDSIEDLSKCMHSSCLLPGIAGPLMNINMSNIHYPNDERQSTSDKFIIANNLQNEDFEPLADALVFEPLPYATAIKEGATHVVVLRSRPDGTDVTGSPSLLERLIISRFFKRKNKLINIFNHMSRHFHKKIYAKQVLELNDAANDTRDYKDVTKPHIMAVALPPGSAETGKLETRRAEIFEGTRRGFARAYDAFVEDPNERGRGSIVAKQCLPDEILDYNPLEIDAGGESAYEFFKKQR